MASFPPPPPGYGGPPPPPAYGGPPPYGGFQPTRSTNGKAIAALVCGICAFATCFPLIGIAAVILAPQAKREISAQPDRYDGAGLALAGQILGWIAIALMVAGVLLFVLAIVLGDSTSSTTTFESLAALAA